MINFGLPQETAVTSNNRTTAPSAEDPSSVAARKAAVEFESVLLTQLTSSLNPKDSEDEDSLFGGSSGMNLSRQMFSEQIAVAMSKAGGIGIANQITEQINGRHPKSVIADASALAARIKGSLEPKSSSPDLISPSNTEKHRPSKMHSTDLARPNSSVNPASYPEARIISEASPSTPGTGPKDLVRPRVVGAASGTQKSSPASLPRSMTSMFSPAAVPVTLQMPVKGLVSSSFGERRDPINGRLRFHEGVDIAAPTGTPISAAAAGTVIFAGSNRGYGKTVVIQHADGRLTRYAHASNILVTQGETVNAGQTIAAVGSTGHSTGPHLHFEVIEEGRHLSPLKALANDFTLARR